MDSQFYSEVPLNLNVSKNCLNIEDSVQSINVKIEAARSGRMNGNAIMYTPKAMIQGMASFLYPFNKHFQNKHYGKAVGVITDAEHIDELFPHASDQFLEIANRFKIASINSNGKELVKAAKELMRTPEYKAREYRGLGIANIYGTIHDSNTIYNLRTNQNHKGKVSIGGSSKEAYCSICSNLVGKSHEHLNGRYYNDELCFYVSNDLYLDHCGFVTVPADPLTHTEVSDELTDPGLDLNITSFKVQDSAENQMNLEKIKQKTQDLDSVKALIKESFTDEAKANLAMQTYENSLKGSRDNHYLISDGRCINLRTPVGIYIAESLIKDMQDSDENKDYLTQIVNKAKKTLNIDNTDKALEETLKEAETGDNDESSSDQKEKQDSTETKSTQDKTEESDNETKVEDKQQDFQEVVLQELRAVKQELESLKTTSVSDSTDVSIIHQELAKLRVALDADEAIIKDLQDNYAKSLKDQIILLKGGKVSEAYQEKLDARTVDELRITLDDITEEKQSLTENKETVTDLEKATTEDAVKNIEDSLQNKEQEEQETPSTAESEKDSDDKEPEEGNDHEVSDDLSDPRAWYAQRLKEVGLTQATKEYNKKFLNK